MARLSAKKKAVLEKMTRESLVSAVERLLQEEGWKGTTMDKIAQEAGVSKGTVYNYFKDKRDILCSVMERNTEGIRAFVRSVDLEIMDPVEVLKEIIERIFNNLYEKRRLIAATIQAYYEDKDLRDMESERKYHEAHPMSEVRIVIADVISAGVESGDFRQVDPRMVEVAINAMTMGVAKQFAMDMLDFSGAEYVSTIRELIMRGLLVDGSRV